MFRTFSTPIFHDGAEETPGGAGAEGTPAAPEPAGAVAAPTGAVTEPVTPAAGSEAAATDYAAKVTEWGGEEAVQRALGIDKALNTLEGQETLIRQGLEARGFNPAQIDAFLASNRPAPGAEPTESVEDLLKDPDRQLTAGEIKRILDHQEAQRNASQTQAAAAVAANSTITTTLTTLQVPEVNRQTILHMADQFLPTPGVVPNDQAVIKLAIEKAHAEFARQVQEEAKAYAEGKGSVAATLPTPLPAAGTGGTESPTEAQSLAEASARVRAKHGIGQPR